MGEREIGEHEQIVLTRDVPSLGLRAGDIGTVVLVHQGGEGFEVEFMAADGSTIGIETLMAADVRLPGRREIPSARALV